MGYSIGSTIAASDYMGFRGANSPATAYPSAIAASNALAALIGKGFGSRGYGQTTTILDVASSGNVVTAALWNGIFSVMNTLNVHTGSGLVLPTAVTPGQLITANDGTSGRPNLPTLITNLDSSRLSYNLADMTLSSKLSSVKTTTWTSTVYHEFTVTFATEDDARYFFNSGGQIYISASRTGGTASNINSSLSTLLSQMGTIKIGAQATTYTGTGGTTYPIGYYGLTGAYQTLFTHNGTTFGYTNMQYAVKARMENITGINGGNGTVLRVQASIVTNVTGPGHNVDGTLTSSVSQLIASGVLTVPSPSYVTTYPL